MGRDSRSNPLNDTGWCDALDDPGRSHSIHDAQRHALNDPGHDDARRLDTHGAEGDGDGDPICGPAGSDDS